MSKQRLEAFSDAVIAIIMTIMVLELKVPHGGDLNSLLLVWPTFVIYFLSFAMLGIYWNNHHHMFHAVDRIGGNVLLANMNLLFWLSLIPFATAWVGENHFAQTPTAVYGIVLFLPAIAYRLLVKAILSHHGANEKLRKAIGKDFKGNFSLTCYALAIPLAFVSCWISMGLYVLVALMWFVPDRRIERKL